MTTRRSFLVGAGCAAGTALIASAQGAESIIDADAALERLIEQERTTIRDDMAKFGIPGAAVCLVCDGKPAWIEGFGVTARSADRRIGVDTIFSIQSTSKNVTTTAIMLAVQRGILDLDRPITTYLPEFTVNSRFEAKPQDRITLRDLLGNRAGFTHDAPVGNNTDMGSSTFEAHVRSIPQTWLRFSPPGDRFRYSNLGFDLAGFILQTVMKKPFAECLQDMVFDPLHMNDSTADARNYARRENRAVGHRQGYDSVPVDIPFVPSGGVYASARDLAAYLRFHLERGRANGRVLLGEGSWNEMHRFAKPGAYSLGVMGGKLRYGSTNVQMLMHNGGGCGFGCVLRFYPQANLGLAVLFNSEEGGAYRWGARLIETILVQRYGVRTARIRIEDAVSATTSPEGLRKFVGNWIGRGPTLNIKLESGLLAVRFNGAERKVRLTSDVDMIMAGDSPQADAIQLRYFPERDGAPAHMESLLGDDHFDYNDGPNDTRGPDKTEWQAYLGEYSVYTWGKPAFTMRVSRNNGYLYLNKFRLVSEAEPGLFFTSDGEVVDFRTEIPTWRSLRLHRIA
jgi:CubicO group peptidase (beta-lactamase class C family)